MNWEVDVVRWANGLVGRSPVLDGIMGQLSDGWVPWALIALAIGYWVWRERRQALVPVLSLTGGVVLADFAGAQLKAAIGRPRPCQVFEVWNRVGGCGAAFSMPSNHVLNTAAAAGFLQVLYPKSGWIMWPLVAVQAFSRMFVAAHYPTDVLVGALIGSALGVVLGLLVEGWRRRRNGLSPAHEA